MLNPEHNISHKLGIALLYIGLALFPLSVATSNAAFALALLCSLFSSKNWGGELWQGMVQLWQRQRLLSLALLAYLIWILIAISWSSDFTRGLKLAARFWVWLLLPVLLIWLSDTLKQCRALLAFSLGMTIHLFITLAQKLGLIEILHTAGSTTEDATGLIGHIGFGFVYGLWAAALAYWGFRYYIATNNHKKTWQRWQGLLAIIIALVSWWLIFSADGRSGYLISIAVVLLLLWKIYWPVLHKRAKIIGVLTVLVLISSLLAVNWHNERVQFTLHSVNTMVVDTFVHKDLTKLQDAESRLSMWFAAWQVFTQQPLLGAGTGSFNVESAVMKQQYPLLFFDEQTHTSHPHQMYLQALAERGIVGLLTLLALLLLWWRIAKNRETDWLTWYLCTASVTAIIIHGLSAPAIDEHFSLILAVLALATGLARQQGVAKKQEIEVI
ncbi:MAG: O-antigen ligase family protein [Mariprofundales bacterium]